MHLFCCLTVLVSGASPHSQVERVLWHLPLLALHWSLKLQMEEEKEGKGKGRKKQLMVGCSDRGEKDGCVGGDWMSVPCESECVLDVNLERRSLKGKVNQLLHSLILAFFFIYMHIVHVHKMHC